MNRLASAGIKGAIALMFVTAGVHATALFVTPQARNESERQLLDLMTNYRQDMGAGFVRSTAELFTALSSCFSFLYLLGGLTLLVLWRMHAPLPLFRAIVGAYTLVFGVAFAVMFALTFLPPIVLTGLVFAALAASWFGLRASATTGS